MNMFDRTRCHEHVWQDEVPWVCLTETMCYKHVSLKNWDAMNMFDRTRCQCHEHVDMATEVPWHERVWQGNWDAMNISNWQDRVAVWTCLTRRLMCHERVPHGDWGAMNVSHTVIDVPWTCPVRRGAWVSLTVRGIMSWVSHARYNRVGQTTIYTSEKSTACVRP